MSLTLNQTAGDDKDVIFTVTVYLDNATLRFCDQPTNLVLDSTFYGGFLTIGDISTGRDLEAGGGVEDNVQFDFSICKNNVTGISNLFNDFFPVTSKPHIIGRVVEVGICWRGATADSDITPYRRYKIFNYSWDAFAMDFNCEDIAELENRMLPNWKLQSDIDDGISYTESIDDKNKGVPVPFVYGIFNNNDILDARKSNKAPAVSKNEYRGDYIIASHPVHTAPSDTLHQFIEQTGTYCEITSTGADTTNNYTGCSVILLPGSTPDVSVLGTLAIPLRDVGYKFSDIKDYSPLWQENTYVVIADDKSASFRVGNAAELSDLGQIGLPASIADSDLRWNIQFSSDDGSTVHIDAYIYDRADNDSLVGSGVIDESTSSTSDTNAQYDFGTDLASRDFARLSQLEFRIHNITSTKTPFSPEDARVWKNYLLVSNILMFRTNVETKKVVTGQGFMIAGDGKAIPIVRTKTIKTIIPEKVEISSRAVMGSVIGKKFGSWLDR